MEIIVFILLLCTLVSIGPISHWDMHNTLPTHTPCQQATQTAPLTCEYHWSSVNGNITSDAKWLFLSHEILTFVIVCLIPHVHTTAHAAIIV